MNKPDREFATGQDRSAFTADDYNQLAEYIESMANLKVEPPLHLNQSASGLSLRLDQKRGFWAKVTGDGNPYGFTQQFIGPDRAFADDPNGYTGVTSPGVGDFSAYEVNGVANLDGTYQWLLPGWTDDFRFQDIAKGGSSHNCPNIDHPIPDTITGTFYYTYSSRSFGGRYPYTYTLEIPITLQFGNGSICVDRTFAEVNEDIEPTIYTGDYWVGDVVLPPSTDVICLGFEPVPGTEFNPICWHAKYRIYWRCGGFTFHWYVEGQSGPLKLIHVAQEIYNGVACETGSEVDCFAVTVSSNYPNLWTGTDPLWFYDPCPPPEIGIVLEL